MLQLQKLVLYQVFFWSIIVIITIPILCWSKLGGKLKIVLSMTDTGLINILANKKNMSVMWYISISSAETLG